MNRRRLWIAVALIATIGTACSLVEANRRKQAAQAEAEKFLTSISTPGPETQSLWGMSELHVFGHSQLLPDMAAGSVRAARIADSPETYDITIPLWVEGQDLNGNPVKLSRQLHVVVGWDQSNARWQVQSYEFREDRPLSIWVQLAYWLLWNFVAGPMVLLLWLVYVIVPALKFLLGFILTEDGILIVALVITGLLALPLAAYISYVFFGSISAVILGTLAYLIVLLLLRSFLERRTARRAS